MTDILCRDEEKVNCLRIPISGDSADLSCRIINNVVEKIQLDHGRYMQNEDSTQTAPLFVRCISV